MTVSTDLSDPVTGQHLTFLQTAEDTDGALLQVLVRLDPGGSVPLHVHARQDERVEVLSGKLSVRVRRAERILEAGDHVEVPRRRRHVVRNVGADDAEFVLEIRPARHMEQTMRLLFAISGILRPVLIRLRRGRRGRSPS